MTRAVTAIGRALGRVDWVLSRLTALATLAVMAVIVADVFGRYVFSSPIGWVYDLVAIFFMNMVLYFLASDTLRAGGHITLDTKLRLLPAPVWKGMKAIAWVAVNIVLLLACHAIAVSAVASLVAGDIHPGLYEWPVWVEKGIVALGLGLVATRVFLNLLLFAFTASLGSLDRQHDQPEASKWDL